MRQAIKILIVLAICGGAVGWYVFARGSLNNPKRSETPGAGGAPGGGGAGKPGMGAPTAVPVAIAHVRQSPVKIFLDGLGTVQAFQIVTARSQVDGIVSSIDFVEGQEIKKGDPVAHIDSRIYQAQVDQAMAKKMTDEAKAQQDRAKTAQDRARKTQDEALEKQAEAKIVQDKALQRQAEAKKATDMINLGNAKVLLKRDEDSLQGNAVSKQVVDDQRSLVNQLESTIAGDEASIESIKATIGGDEVAVQAVKAAIAGDEAAIQSDEAAVRGDEAAIQADAAMIRYAETFLSYCTIKSPIDGRTGVRLVDAGNVVHANDAISNSTGMIVNGIVVVTQLQPISVVFTLPQQNLQAINARRAASKLSVIAVDSDKVELDRGELLLVDNQIDSTTGTIKLKATFPNTKLNLWPGGFVNIRLLLETREDALAVSSPAIQQGPNGTFVFIVKPDTTPPDPKAPPVKEGTPPASVVEMRPVKVALIQDGKAIIQEGLAKDDEVVLSGHDKLKSGSRVTIDRTKYDKNAPDKPKRDVSSGAKPVDEVNHPVEEAGAARKSASGAAK